ncbi:MAG: PilZ domain-containing protein [Planctomycetota bacterium]|nr:PilZ domain-containing protein [Planctomycetota bacterium]
MTNDHTKEDRADHKRGTPIQAIEVHSSQGEPLGHVLNLSHNGMRFQTGRAPAPDGSVLDLVLRKAGTKTSAIHVRAMVRWSKPVAPTGDHELGAEFAAGMALEDSRELARLLLFSCT